MKIRERKNISWQPGCKGPDDKKPGTEPGDLEVENVDRCPWCVCNDKMIRYHDEEWGKPVSDDRTLFEFMVLESAQAGLSWITILRKREGYRTAFHNFDAEKVAQMTPADIDRLMRFDGIVRNSLKIKSTIANARLFLDIRKEFGSFYEYTLSFFPGRQPIVNNFKTLSQVPATSYESDAMSKDMKKRGFRFFGSTIWNGTLANVCCATGKREASILLP